MVDLLFASYMRMRAPLFAAAVLVPLVGQPLDAGVRGEFDFPLEVAAVAAPRHAVSAESSARCYEVTIPVSFRTIKGSAGDVLQIEIELIIEDDDVLILGYEPQTTLSGDVIGEIEETVTTEQAKGLNAAVGASVPIPGLKAAQIGPSVNASDSERTVRTQKTRRRPQLAAIVVSGSTARGRGVFFQLRPAPDLTLEGAHYLTLHLAAPGGLAAAAVAIKCRAVADEDWLLFERRTRIAAASGQTRVAFLKDDEASAALRHSAERPCPICDAPPVRRPLPFAGNEPSSEISRVPSTNAPVTPNE